MRLIFLTLYVFHILNFSRSVNRIQLQASEQAYRVVACQQASRHRQVKFSLVVVLRVLFCLSRVPFRVISPVPFQRSRINAGVKLIRSQRRTLQRGTRSRRERRRNYRRQDGHRVAAFSRASRRVFGLVMRFNIVKVFKFAQFHLLRSRVPRDHHLHRDRCPAWPRKCAGRSGR